MRGDNMANGIKIDLPFEPTTPGPLNALSVVNSISEIQIVNK